MIAALKNPQVLTLLLNTVGWIANLAYQKFCRPVDNQVVQEVNTLLKTTQQNQVEVEERLVEPDDFVKAEKKLDKKFIQVLHSIKLTQIINKQDGRRHICFIGPTSAGKSTLLNELFHLSEQVGLGSTTVQAKPVAERMNVVIWDVPGVSNEWESFCPQNLCFFHSIDYVYVLYDKEPKENKRLIKILQELKKPFTLVRTKCDNWKPEDIRTIEQWIQDDKIKFKDLCKFEHNVISTGKGQRDQLKADIFSRLFIKESN